MSEDNINYLAPFLNIKNENEIINVLIWFTISNKIVIIKNVRTKKIRFRTKL